MAPTIVGWLYWNFGTFGVLVGLFVFGVLSRSAYQYLLLNRDNLSSLYLYLWLVGVQMQACESPQLALNSIVLTLPIISIVIAFSGRRAVTCSRSGPELRRPAGVWARVAHE